MFTPLLELGSRWSKNRARKRLEREQSHDNTVEAGPWTPLSELQLSKLQNIEARPKQDLERELEGKFLPLNLFLCDFGVVKKATTAWWSSPSCFFVCCNEESNDSLGCCCLLVYLFVTAKKAMIVKLSLFSCFFLLQRRRGYQQSYCHLLFWSCCSKKDDGNKATVAFFCCSKEGDNNFVVVAFCFHFAAMKKATIAKLLSSFILVLL